MQLADFDYELPAERIAQVPVEPRDSARLLVARPDGGIDDRHVSDLPDLLQPGDLVVVNTTKVIPARVRLQRATGGQAEVLLLEPLDGERRTWEALVRPGKKLKVGERLVAGDGAEVVEIGPRRPAGDTFAVTLLAGDAAFDALAMLDERGEMPLPPYITERLADADRYQTVYADDPGSAAAPTAGLHLTDRLIKQLADRGIGFADVDLLVGLDTFRPIDTDDPLDHRMHTERYRVPAATMEACTRTRVAGGRVIAVGTTTVRALESAATTGELEGRTDIFIYAGYDWKIVDAMMTNFHLPRTTLLMMIDAFVGDRWRDLYAHALATEYRFLSFGDAMLIERPVTQPGVVSVPWRPAEPAAQQAAIERSLTQFPDHFGDRAVTSEFLSQIILGPSRSWAFISTGKNASTTTLRFLFEAEFGVPLTVRFDPLHDINPDAVVHQLAAHGVFQRALTLGLDAQQIRDDSNLLRICIVRHPLDRAISGFRYFCRSNELEKSWFLGDRLRANAIGFDWDTMPHTARGFEKFLRFIQHEQNHVGVSRLDAHWRPQADFIKPDVFAPGLIGRMEHLDDFFGELAERLNTPARPPTARANAQPSVTRAEFASDPAVRRLVRSIYASDYEAFGYDEWNPS